MRDVLVKKKSDRDLFPPLTWKIMVYRIIEDSRRFFSFEVPYDMLVDGSDPYSVDHPESELGKTIKKLKNNEDLTARMAHIPS
jgi:hypothetical protein